MDATNVNRHVAHAAAPVRPVAEAADRDALISTANAALDALEPMVLRLLADPAVSAEHALHVVVMEPPGDAPEPGPPFERAILVERSFGDRTRWQADYRAYALAKTRVSWRERESLRALLAVPERLQADDIRVEGAVCENGFTVGASGAQPYYDHAFASATIAMIEAMLAAQAERRKPRLP